MVLPQGVMTVDTHVRGSAGAPDLVGVPEKVASPGFELRTPLWAQDFAPRFL